MKIKLSKEELKIVLLTLKGKLLDNLKEEEKKDEKVAVEDDH